MGKWEQVVLENAARDCNEKGTGCIVLPGGICEIHHAGAKKDFDDLMSGATDPRSVWKDGYSPYHTCVAFEDVDGLVIDGNGATLVFEGLIQPFGFKRCRNLTVKNLKIDWTRPLFSEGIIRSVRGDVIEVGVFPEYPVKGGEPVISFQNFDPETGHLGGVCPFVGITNMKLVSPQVITIQSTDARLLKPGQMLVMRHLYNYRPGFDLVECDNVKFIDVTIHALPGMGVYGTRCRDISLLRYRVCPSGKRIMSGNVDGVHLVSTRGTVEFDDCYFEGMGDDAANLHGFYFTVGEKLDDCTVRVFISHQFAPGEKYRDYPDIGDDMEFVHGDTLLSYDRRVVRDMKFDDNLHETVLRFDKPLPAKFVPGDLIANISALPKLRFRGNTVQNIRGRGVLVQTRDVVIENNHFLYCTGQGIHVDTAAPWMEACGTRDVTIRHNRFIGCGYGLTNYCDATGIMVETECKKPSVGVHKNLVIEDNLFIGGSKPAVCLSCTDGAVIRNNRVMGPGEGLKIMDATNINTDIRTK